MSASSPSAALTFPLCLGTNMLVNLLWTIPAWALLVCHFVIGWPLWLFWAALGIWLVVMVGVALFLMAVDHAPKDSGPTTRPDPAKREEIFAKSRAVADMDQQR